MSLWINSEQGGPAQPIGYHACRPNQADSSHEQDFTAANVDIKVFDEEESLPKQKHGNHLYQMQI